MMPADWSVEIDGEEYRPVPETWLEAGIDEGYGRPRVYAVSVAVVMRGGAVRVRYSHPRTANVLALAYSAVENSDGSGYIPERLVGSGDRWPRSVVPCRVEDPHDVLRAVESDYLRSVWGPRTDEIPTDAEVRKIADGGAFRGVFDV